jgi:hypothetical protein
MCILQHVPEINWGVVFARNGSNSLSTADGRVRAQAVSRQLFNAAAWVRARVRSCGICGGQSGTGAGFL